MISDVEARRLILSGLAPLRPRRAPITALSGQVLAEKVHAAESVPRFANSAMDGYAVIAADTVRAPVRLSVIGAVAAGDDPEAVLSRGAAMRIMTGAPIPPGADAVCILERARSEDSGLAVLIKEALTPGTNERQAGEDVAVGAEVFGRGTQLGPAQHVCGRCGRRLESAWSNGRPAYRCRHGYSSAVRPEPGRPGNTYVREDQILPHLAAIGILLAGPAGTPVRGNRKPPRPQIGRHRSRHSRRESAGNERENQTELVTRRE